MSKQNTKKMNQQQNREIPKRVDPYKDFNHKESILNKEQVKKRNEATKDYSKEMNKTNSGQRGPGRSMYLGGKAKNTKGTALRIWNYLGRYKAGLIVVIIGVIITSALSALIPWLFAKALDDYIWVFDYEGAAYIAILLVFIALITSFVRFVSRYTMAIISQRTVKKIRKDAFDKLQNLSVNYYDTNQPGDIVSRITNDVDLISNSLSTFTIEMFGSIVTLVVSLFMMFYINWADRKSVV